MQTTLESGLCDLPSKQIDFAEQITKATLYPYLKEASDISEFWLANCPASNCFDGEISADVDLSCGTVGSNLCHTKYSDEDHFLTYTFRYPVYIGKVSIYNRIYSPDLLIQRLKHYQIRVGNNETNLTTCAAGFGDTRADQLYENCCGSVGKILQLR